MQHRCEHVMGKCSSAAKVTADEASVLKKQLLEAARDPLAAWLDDKVNKIVINFK